MKDFQASNPFWDKLNNFFSVNDFEGGQEFYAYTQAVREQNQGEDFPAISAKDFNDYLNGRRDHAQTPEEKQRYEKLINLFSAVKTEDLKGIAQVFSHFNLGGKATGVKRYQETLDRAKKFNV